MHYQKVSFLVSLIQSAILSLTLSHVCVCVWVSDRSGCSCCWDFSDPGVKCRTRDEIRQQRERKSKDLMHGNGESTWNHYLSRQQGCYSGWVYSIFVYGCLCLRTVLNVPYIFIETYQFSIMKMQTVAAPKRHQGSIAGTLQIPAESYGSPERT